ncbi:hypothetical protein HON52_01260 [Candidatus Uhrbacteria bacterium]|jgi:hypothetical protein|nr:hypothetical protein [Candidatus Uhrbacteria bacterium]
MSYGTVAAIASTPSTSSLPTTPREVIAFFRVPVGPCADWNVWAVVNADRTDPEQVMYAQSNPRRNAGELFVILVITCEDVDLLQACMVAILQAAKLCEPTLGNWTTQIGMRILEIGTEDVELLQLIVKDVKDNNGQEPSLEALIRLMCMGRLGETFDFRYARALVDTRVLAVIKNGTGEPWLPQILSSLKVWRNLGRHEFISAFKSGLVTASNNVTDVVGEDDHIRLRDLLNVLDRMKLAP